MAHQPHPPPPPPGRDPALPDLSELSVADARTLDRWSIERHRIPGLLLMEQASIGLALAVCDRVPAKGRVGVICGPGNNGGDGLAVARHLDNAGLEVVTIDLVGADRPRASDAGVQRTIAEALELPLLDTLPEPLPAVDLWVDAIFGTGLSRPPEGILRAAIEALNESGVPILAVDVPSGLDADRGVPLEAAVRATETVTLGLPKRGFLTPEAEPFTGTLRYVPIGASWKLLPEGVPAFPPVPVPLPPADGVSEDAGSVEPNAGSDVES